MIRMLVARRVVVAFVVALALAPAWAFGQLSIRSTTSNANTAGSTVTVTVPSVEDGDLLVGLGVTNNNGLDVNTVTSTGLTWTRRQAIHNAANGFAGVWTAVRSGTTLTDHVVTLTDDDGSGGGRALTVRVYTAGSWLSSQTFANGTTASGNSATPSISLTTASDSHMLASLHGGTTGSVAPDADTTEIYDNPSPDAGRWHGSNVTSNTSKTVSGTFAAAKQWRFAALEIEAAAGGGPPVCQSGMMGFWGCN